MVSGLVYSTLTRLRVLNLAYCQLSGPFDSSLAKLKSLFVISFSGNVMFVPVPEFFGDFSHLTSLTLKGCYLNGKFPEKIFQLPLLENLDISFNFELQGSIPDSFGNLERLTRIVLAVCRFNGSIPDSVARLTQLVYLDFSRNNFSGRIPSFLSLKNLVMLNLASNRLSGSTLSTKWSGLSKLVSINLGDNLLDGEIPASLFGIHSLQKVVLSQNQFTGRLDALSGLASSALVILYLDNNKLSGPFPMFILGLKSLQELELLSSNNFSGSVYILIMWEWIGGNYS